MHFSHCTLSPPHVFEKLTETYFLYLILLIARAEFDLQSQENGMKKLLLHATNFVWCFS